MNIKPTMRQSGRMMFDIKVTFSIGLEELAYAIYNQMHIFARPLPLLRRECLECVRVDLARGNSMQDDWRDEIDEEEFERIKAAVARLFPELKS